MPSTLSRQSHWPESLQVVAVEPSESHSQATQKEQELQSFLINKNTMILRMQLGCSLKPS